MISGYNTDVRHQDVVFHVQTEDKGAGNPFIESLVYVGGRVLAARRASYAELLEAGKGAKAISELMDLQHRRMIAAIRQGRFDAKLEILLGRALSDQPAAAAEAAAQEADAQEAEDVLAATKITEAERTLDQVILEYLTSEAQQEQLQLTVEGDPELVPGLPARLRVRALSSQTATPLSDVHVDVRLISTVAEARTLASGDTDPEGLAQLSFLIPELGSGTAALIISAESRLGTAELKRLL